ncbi:FmdE family protein [Desulforhopalus singaporensis]|uniref:Formylmethanofuran dehydrogenase, subunit E n=1 Tax=Desulforhopalus singaporensis TaxID=91360 RepID=A0A1H0MGA8_9BACT|nr:FmdE family protein [Desulforhopalus singaporensis]SDO79434.1 formylmethanofuran dehydrogenase, subunit E [Desulforhopalus singaporensis]
MYIPESIRSRDDYKACVKFHGHTCMGLTIGYLAATLALSLLAEARAEDEEVIAVVENDACCCDAIQVLTGCTFGKGNFFHLDYGKMAFTFGSRSTKRGVRLLLRNDIFHIPEREKYLAEKISSNISSDSELKEYEQLYEARGEDLFSRGAESFFDVEQIANLELPKKAVIAQSVACADCGEMVMKTKLLEKNRRTVCRSCATHLDN